jgi:hypothetical protein
MGPIAAAESDVKRTFDDAIVRERAFARQQPRVFDAFDPRAD